MNTLKTILLLGILSSLIIGLGGLFGGREGVFIAFFFALVMNVGSYWFSDKIALAAHGAMPLSREEAPDLYEIVERLSAKADIPTPPIYLIPSESPNAFATGRDPEHSAIAVTEGILRLLNLRELEGVLAHELGHVKNRDVLITTIAAVLASVITWIAHMGMFLGDGDRENAPNPIFALLLAILAPFAATIINLAISRAREFEADATGAHLCGRPLELASALTKIDDSMRVVPMREANPAYSSLYISNPDPQSLL
ncbi:MAG TPA: M48 family metalloprotease, partial [Candidatus Obscuribacterales bacterium]